MTWGSIPFKVACSQPWAIEFLNFHNPQVETQHLQLSFLTLHYQSPYHPTCDTPHLRLSFSRCGLHRQFIFIGREPWGESHVSTSAHSSNAKRYRYIREYLQIINRRMRILWKSFAVIFPCNPLIIIDDTRSTAKMCKLNFEIEIIWGGCRPSWSVLCVNEFI